MTTNTAQSTKQVLLSDEFSADKAKAVTVQNINFTSAELVAVDYIQINVDGARKIIVAVPR